MAKILLHTLIFSPDAVSTAYLMTDLARQLQRQGHQITVLSSTPHYSLDTDALRRQSLKRHWPFLLYRSNCDGVTVWHIRLPMKRARILTRVLDYVYFHIMALIVGRMLIEAQDIVIAPSPPLTIGVIGWLLSRKWHVPFIYNVQEIYPDFAIHQGYIRNRVIIDILRRVERFVYEHSAAVVAISDRFRTIIAARGVPESKLHVIPNSVDTGVFQPSLRQTAFAQRHGLLDKFVVFYGGNIGYSQDWDALLFAAGNLSSMPIHFLIIGEGIRKKWLAQQCAERGLANVTLMDYQPRGMVPEIYSSADICVIPMREGATLDTFPSKIYTIMACGKSVIVQADEDSELNTLIQSAKSGRVVPPGNPQLFCDAILRAYNERAELAAEGARARQHVVEGYSQEAVGQKYCKLIESLKKEPHA